MVVEFLVVAVSLGVLCVSALLAAVAVHRSAEAEKIAAQRPPSPYGPAPRPPYAPAPLSPRYGPRPSPPSPRGLWVGAAATGILGFVLLVAVVGSLLFSMSGGDRMLVTPVEAGGLERHDDPELRASLERQKEYMRQAGVPHPTVALYREHGTPDGSVAFAGGWGRIPDPGGHLRGMLRSMGRPFGAGSRPRSFPPGPLEGEVLCLSGASVDHDSLPICGWADRSTIGVVMARGRTVAECADILQRMRPDMEKEKK